MAQVELKRWGSGFDSMIAHKNSLPPYKPGEATRSLLCRSLRFSFIFFLVLVVEGGVIHIIYIYIGSPDGAMILHGWG